MIDPRESIGILIYDRYNRMWSTHSEWEDLAEDQKQQWIRFVGPWIDLFTENIESQNLLGGENRNE